MLINGRGSKRGAQEGNCCCSPNDLSQGHTEEARPRSGLQGWPMAQGVAQAMSSVSESC